MSVRWLFGFFLILLSGPLAFGQTSGERFSLFSGVSCQEEAIHGGNASLSFQVSEPFSFIVDFSAHRRSQSGIFAPDIVYGLLGGQAAFGEFGGMKPFARLTAGIGHRDRELSSSLSSLPNNVFVVGAGGGVDFQWADNLDFRVIQVDYFRHEEKADYPSHLRFSFGLVVSF